MELVEYLLVENNQHQEILLTMLPLHKQEMQLTLVIYLQQDMDKHLLILQQEVYSLEEAQNTDDQEYITMSTLGNSAKFGDLAGGTREQLMGASNSVRGLVMGGNDPAAVNVVDYFTIATLGSSADYGDLTQARKYGTGAASKTRVCAAGGVCQPSAPSTSITTIDYTQVMSLGDFIDFGDLTRWTDGD